MRPGIAVIGSLNADLVVRLERRPAPGETVLGGDLTVHPGGKGANQAVAAARLGGDVVMVGCVGADEHGGLLRRSLSRSGVDVAMVTTVTDRPTGTALITVTPDGENAIVVSPGANACLTPATLGTLTADLHRVGVVVTQLELAVETVAAAAQRARELSARLVLNCAPAMPVPGPVLQRADPVVVNQHELATLTGRPDLSATDPAAAARLLLDRGVRSVVVTLGAAGALLCTAAEITTLPAPAVPVVDTTGAGDAFVGALAAELAAGRSLAEGVRLAVAAGTAAVSRAGAQPSFPCREELGC